MTIKYLQLINLLLNGYKQNPQFGFKIMPNATMPFKREGPHLIVSVTRNDEMVLYFDAKDECKMTNIIYDGSKNSELEKYLHEFNLTSLKSGQFELDIPKERRDFSYFVSNVYMGLSISHPEVLISFSEVLRNLKKIGHPLQGITIKNPRQSTTLSNDLSFDSEDLLNITPDVESFAYNLRLRSLDPPIALALFGNWGSGKTYFMKKLQNRMKEFDKIEEATDDHNRKLCKYVLHIEFNAWSYLDSNLWASLVSKIFERLDEYINENSKVDLRKQVSKQLSESLFIMSEKKRKIDSEIHQLTVQKEAIATALLKLETEEGPDEADIAKKTYKMLEAEVMDKISIDDSIKAKLREYGLTREFLYANSPDKIFQQFNSSVSFFKALFKFTPLHIVAICLCALLFIVLIFNPGKILSSLDTVQRGFLALLTFIGPAIAKTITTFNRYKALFQPLAEFRDRFNENISEAVLEHQRHYDDLKNQETQIAQRKLQLTTELAEVEEKIVNGQVELDHFLTHRAFKEFVSQKNNDESYSGRLGFISVVRKDLEILSDLFEGVGKAFDDKNPKQLKKSEFHSMFSKPLERIVLYIDDLDRCPEDKALEVLQAVHLLMAFPLFIVIVGVDQRAIRNTLIYRNVSQYGPFVDMSKVADLGIDIVTPEEYLEKIFQIVFHIKPLSPDQVKKMTHSLLEDEIEEETSKVKVRSNRGTQQAEGATRNSRLIDNPKILKELTLLKDEYQCITEMSVLIGNSPRKIKIFLNIYRIVRSHEIITYEIERQAKTFTHLMFCLVISVGKYHSFFEDVLKICKRDEKKLIADTLKEANVPNEVVETLEKNADLKFILSDPSKEFLRYADFVSRFSLRSKITY